MSEAASTLDVVLSWPAPLLPTLPGTGPALKLHDTSRGEVVATEPQGTARMYVCGITPYDATHAGHAAVKAMYVAHPSGAAWFPPAADLLDQQLRRQIRPRQPRHLLMSKAGGRFHDAATR